MNLINHSSKTLFLCLTFSILFIHCQSSEEELADLNTDVEDPITQLVTESNTSDLSDLPVTANYIKEQSLKGQNPSPYGYVIRRPEGFGLDGKKYPILIYLHGAGSRGNSDVNPEDLNKVDTGGGMGSIKNGYWSPQVAMPIIAPQCPTGTNWQSESVYAFIQYIIDTYPDSINLDRIYLSGFSMGGFGTWSYLDYYGYENSQVAAVVTMAGAGEDSGSDVEALKYMPFWLFHGQLDGAVNVTRSINVANRFRSVYPEQNHQKLTIFTQNDPENHTRGYHRIDYGIYYRELWEANQTEDLFNEDVMNWMLKYKRNN